MKHFILTFTITHPTHPYSRLPFKLENKHFTFSQSSFQSKVIFLKKKLKEIHSNLYITFIRVIYK